MSVLTEPGFTELFENDLATWLAEQVDGLAYDLAGPYAPDTVGIYLAGLPTRPDLAVAITTYASDDHTGLNSDTVAVQVRTRGTTDPRTAQRIEAAIHDAMQGATHVDLPTAYVVHIARQSQAQMGPDSSGRYELASNYNLALNRPTQHRPH